MSVKVALSCAMVLSSGAGHSLGGAVAQICTLDLLKSLEKGSLGRAPISCIGYATPAFGNASLASLVRENGWDPYFMNYLLPGEARGLVICTSVPV